MSLTREEIHKLLVASKIEYVQMIGDGTGMCKALDKTCEKLFPHVVNFATYDYLYRLIPEFNPQYLGSPRPHDGYWWALCDCESRLEAFDKLISLYQE